MQSFQGKKKKRKDPSMCLVNTAPYESTVKVPIAGYLVKDLFLKSVFLLYYIFNEEIKTNLVKFIINFKNGNFWKKTIMPAFFFGQFDINVCEDLCLKLKKCVSVCISLL